jgi:hypothetical protein
VEDPHPYPQANIRNSCIFYGSSLCFNGSECSALYLWNWVQIVEFFGATVSLTRLQVRVRQNVQATSCSLQGCCCSYIDCLGRSVSFFLETEGIIEGGFDGLTCLFRSADAAAGPGHGTRPVLCGARMSHEPNPSRRD